MSKYGSGLTLGKACNFKKEQIKHAFNNEIMRGANENGIVYAPCTREEAEKFILAAYDEVVYQALQLAASGRAMGNLLTKKYGSEGAYFEDYVAERTKEETKFNDYVYESEEDE